MKTLILAIGLASCVTACTVLENYEFGDATRAALKIAAQINALKADYCSTPNGPSRDLILQAIRRVDPEYVGVCVVEAP